MSSPVDRSRPQHPSWLRVGDQEREQAAAALAEHYAHGRLTHGEHGDRLDAAWSARTRADLDLLFHDLPATGRPTPTPATAAWGTRAPGRTGRSAPSPWLLLLAIVGAVVLVSEVPFLPMLLLAFIAFVAIRRHRRRERRPIGPPVWR